MAPTTTTPSTTTRTVQFASSARNGNNEQRKQGDGRSQHLILLVDDDDELRMAMGTLLEQEGYRVKACPSAETALEWLESNKNINDDNAASLIVSDIRMPGGMDGLDFLQHLRMNRDWTHLPVVLLTAKGQTQDRIAGYNAGADAYLTKPFAPEELVSLMDSLLERQKRFAADNNNAVTLEDLRQDLAEIRTLLQNGGAGQGTPGFVDAASRVFLAPDERSILELVCEGLSNQDIAARTFLSTRRVQQLLTTLYRKTGVSNRTELVRWAVRTGTVKL